MIFEQSLFLCVKTSQQRNLEMEYSVSLNYKSNYWSQLKAGKNALLYQKLLAGVSKVLADNLNKTFTVESK